MKGAVGIAALGCVLTGANAKWMKWSPEYESQRWLPAQQTLSAMLDIKGMTPKPTDAPIAAEVPVELKKRDSTDNTCAYISGKFTSSLYCDPSDACVYNSKRFFIGCCPETSIACPIPTTCYASTDAASFTTDNGYTLFCGGTRYPQCVTHLYAKDDPLFSGYTLLGCGVAAATDTVYYEAKDGTATSSTKTLKAGNTATTATGTGGGAVTVTVDPGASTTTPSTTSGGGGGGGGGGSSTNAGAIAGGVVGGVAGLGLIGLAIWLIVRQANKKKDQQTPPNAAAAVAAPPPAGQSPPGFPQQPHMAQYPPPAGAWDPNQPQPGGFAPVYDPRASIAKPPYDVTNTNSMYQPSFVTGSPPGSPPPQSPHTPVYNQGHTPPPGAQYPSGYAVSSLNTNSPQAGYAQSPVVSNTGYQHPQGYQFAAELPTQRGDGEVRELA